MVKLNSDFQLFWRSQQAWGTWAGQAGCALSLPQPSLSDPNPEDM